MHTLPPPLPDIHKSKQVFFLNSLFPTVLKKHPDRIRTVFLLSTGFNLLAFQFNEKL